MQMGGGEKMKKIMISILNTGVVVYLSSWGKVGYSAKQAIQNNDNIEKNKT